MKNKCIVTGGAGMIGIYVARELIRRKFDVTIYDLGEQIILNKKFIPKEAKLKYGSILDQYNLTNTFKDCHYVFHLAAMLGVKNTEDNKLDCLEINCEGTKNVLNACVKNRVKKVLFASSSEVYGEPDKNPIIENFSTKGKTIYGVSKMIGEEYCKSFYQKYKLNYTILRYFNTYGVYQKKQFVLSKFINNAMKNKTIIINGDGSQKRSYIYAEDTAKGTVLSCMSKKTNQKIYNLGNSYEPISLVTLKNKISKILKKKLKVKFNKSFLKNIERDKNREIFFRYCDSSKLEKVLNWRPKVSLDQGIKLIIKSYKNN